MPSGQEGRGCTAFCSWTTTPHILTTNEKFFRQKGYEVFCAGTAQDALHITATATLDAIILDADLPGLDGLFVCRRIREVSRVPVIFLSAYARTDDRIQGLIGQPEGDRAFQTFAHQLEGFFNRGGDITARSGGDEFAVFVGVSFFLASYCETFFQMLRRQLWSGKKH